MSEKIIKWGFIGCGEVTKYKSGPAFQKIEHSEVVAVMSRDISKAKAYAKERGIAKWYNDAQELINDEDVNAVYIATPPSSHATYAIMSMKAGKPVYIEKPMAVTYEECCRINRISQETGIPCFVAYYRRYLPYFLKVKSLVEEGAIGNVINIQIRFAQPPRDLDYNKENLPWRVQPDIAGGGYFYDLAPHQIDILQDMFGYILEANGYKSNRGGLYSAEDTLSANARNGEAVKKIFVAKGRPQDNPLIVHVTGPEMLPGLVSEVPERAQLLMAAFCPGPLTIIMPRGPEVAAECCAGLDTVGIRMPSHPVARAVIAQSGCAFAAPSANLSGKPSPTNAQDVFTDMDGRLPLILDGGECDVGVESTVISVVGEKPTLFRPGHITLEDLERALGEEVEVSKAILEKLPEGAVVRSPGMKYKHYAPKADVTLLEGTFEQFKAYVDAHADQNPSCLCFTGEAEKLGWPCVEYGREGDGADQAKHIFRSLRALDEQGDGVVYARCPKKDGLSMAVYNRLIRAAAFRVIQL
mgnify:CR=1 FL=1